MRLYEIIGTIAVLATLFSSVGFSVWTYGENLLPNPNFTDNITGWNEEGATWVNDSGNGIANLTGNYLMTSPYGLGDISVGEYFYWSFWFKTDNASDMLQINMDGANDIGINTTTVCDWSACTGFPSSNYIESMTNITEQGEGWFKFETIYYASAEGGIIDSYVESYTPTSVQIDNAVIEEAMATPLNLSIGLSEPANNARSGVSPITFSYAVLSNYEVLNCSLVTSDSHGTIKATNTVPIVTGGGLNYISLGGIFSKHSFTWSIACKTAYDPMMYYMSGNRTYTYDTLYAGAVATSILKLAPMFLGLLVGLLTFVWVMTKEDENTIGVIVHLVIMYIVLIALLVIIYGILG